MPSAKWIPLLGHFPILTALLRTFGQQSSRACSSIFLVPAVMATLPPGEIEYQLAHIHDDRSGELYGTQITCFALACIAVALRLMSRRLIKAKLMADDYMILFALVPRLLVVLNGDHC